MFVQTHATLLSSREIRLTATGERDIALERARRNGRPVARAMQCTSCADASPATLAREMSSKLGLDSIDEALPFATLGEPR
jgi:hypothetical protein